MVYDDTRWVQRLKSMGCWNEGEARSRFEDAMKMKWEARRRKEEEMKKAGTGVNGVSGGGLGGLNSMTLFDANMEEEKARQAMEAWKLGQRISVDGFDSLTLSDRHSTVSEPTAVWKDPQSMLQALKSVKSVRGQARQEYAKVYGALGPFYNDLVRAKSHMDPVIFRIYRDPAHQAQMLAQLKVFAKSDWAQGWQQREERLDAMTGIFETALLREFEQ
jgi:recyclin-1